MTSDKKPTKHAQDDDLLAVSDSKVFFSHTLLCSFICILLFCQETGKVLKQAAPIMEKQAKENIVSTKNKQTTASVQGGKAIKKSVLLPWIHHLESGVEDNV